MSKTHFQWIDHAYESYGFVLFRGEKTKATAHLTSHDGKTWHVAVEGLWWRSRLLEDSFATRDGAKHGAEQAVARSYRELAQGLGATPAGEHAATVPMRRDRRDPLYKSLEKIEAAHALLQEAIGAAEAAQAPARVSG